MKISETYSHLNGLEFLLVHKQHLWQEMQDVIAEVDADKCRTKVSREKTMKGEFYNIVRQGRGVPAVPLVLIGIEP